ncbi:hypothetical protein Pcinc_003992 [Petrolisthes cinctipes]|uniref:Uncharacterized protein n=1 Tax=Petrolisthes cinctipes TaxID=88211 RepID=A0AAE1GHZ3_PETCI|nr:hypothetical protein Pcinc_003992 [Petrolisthes cinctipes]
MDVVRRGCKAEVKTCSTERYSCHHKISCTLYCSCDSSDTYLNPFKDGGDEEIKVEAGRTEADVDYFVPVTAFSLPSPYSSSSTTTTTSLFSNEEGEAGRMEERGTPPLQFILLLLGGGREITSLEGRMTKKRREKEEEMVTLEIRRMKKKKREKEWIHGIEVEERTVINATRKEEDGGNETSQEYMIHFDMRRGEGGRREEMKAGGKEEEKRRQRKGGGKEEWKENGAWERKVGRKGQEWKAKQRQEEDRKNEHRSTREEIKARDRKKEEDIRKDIPIIELTGRRKEEENEERRRIGENLEGRTKTKAEKRKEQRSKGIAKNQRLEERIVKEEEGREEAERSGKEEIGRRGKREEGRREIAEGKGGRNKETGNNEERGKRDDVKRLNTEKGKRGKGKYELKNERSKEDERRTEVRGIREDDSKKWLKERRDEEGIREDDDDDRLIEKDTGDGEEERINYKHDEKKRIEDKKNEERIDDKEREEGTDEDNKSEGRRENGDKNVDEILEGGDKDVWWCDDDGEWRCSDGVGCVREEDKCNGIPECQDGSDEEVALCGCLPYEYQCESECVDLLLRCDTNPDCQYQEDETGCGPMQSEAWQLLWPSCTLTSSSFLQRYLRHDNTHSQCVALGTTPKGSSFRYEYPALGGGGSFHSRAEGQCCLAERTGLLANAQSVLSSPINSFGRNTDMDSLDV